MGLSGILTAGWYTCELCGHCARPPATPCKLKHCPLTGGWQSAWAGAAPVINPSGSSDRRWGQGDIRPQHSMAPKKAAAEVALNPEQLAIQEESRRLKKKALDLKVTICLYDA